VVAAAALAAIEADLRQRGRDARRIAGATFRIALELLSGVEALPLPNVKEGTLNRHAELREDRLRLMIIRLIKFLLLEIDYCYLFEVGW
jgi:hypothetical protein